MGLITAAINAVTGTLESQWKEYFYCDAMPESVLATKAMKKTKGVFGFKVEDENVISQGSVVAVADGQCMMIVDQGKIVDFCAEPGEYIFDANGQPLKGVWVAVGEVGSEELLVKLETGADGRYAWKIDDLNKDYFVVFQKEGYVDTVMIPTLHEKRWRAGFRR